MSNPAGLRLSAAAFVTGATGFLGYEIAKQLVDEGVTVHALSRSGQLPGDLLSCGVKVVHGDLGSEAQLRDAIPSGATVYHVAADVNMWRQRWAASVASNVVGTRNIARAALKAGASRFVFTSTAGTIGKPLSHTGPEPLTIDESNTYNLGPLQMVYPHTKWLAEQEVLAAIDRGLDAVLTHPAAVLGPRDWKLNTLPLFQAPRRAMTLAVPGGYRTTCDVRDVARAHLLAADRGPCGARYILGGACVSVAELFEHIVEEVGGLRPLLRMPDRVVLGLGRVMDAVANLTDRPPSLSWEMALQSTMRVRLSSAKAERELGYQSRPLSTSIRDAVAWFRQRGVL